MKIWYIHQKEIQKKYEEDKELYNEIKNKENKSNIIYDSFSDWIISYIATIYFECNLFNIDISFSISFLVWIFIA